MAKATERVNINLKGFKVENVRRITDTVVAFSLLGNGIGLYSLKVIKGKNGDFISAPQTKGKDGKWYNNFSVYFSDEDEAKVIKKVLEKAPAASEDDL